MRVQEGGQTFSLKRGDQIILNVVQGNDNDCYFSRFVWMCLIVAAACYCIYSCQQNIDKYLQYPTMLRQSHGGTNISYPDITICNARGYDLAVMKNILEYLQYRVNLELNRTSLNEEITPERFTHVYYENIIEKYRVFLFDYFLTSYSPEVQTIFDMLFSRIKLKTFMSQEDSMELGVPGWQLIIDCSYGKSNHC